MAYRGRDTDRVEKDCKFMVRNMASEIYFDNLFQNKMLGLKETDKNKNVGISTKTKTNKHRK